MIDDKRRQELEEAIEKYNESTKKYTHVSYCSDLTSLRKRLKSIHPNDIIAITETNGYTVVYRSDSEYYKGY